MNKSIVTISFVLIALFTCCINKNKQTYRQIADFETTDKIWMSCINNPNFLYVSSELINLQERNLAIQLTAQANDVIECQNFFNISTYNDESLDYSIINGNEFWLRDLGPVFVMNSKEQICVVDFKWTQYGYQGYLEKYYNGDQEAVAQKLKETGYGSKMNFDSLIASKLDLSIIKSWIALEGGGIETNGNGTLILNKSMILQRNPKATISALESEFERVLGTTNIIWLNNGLAEDVHIVGTIIDDFVGIGTGGHTDEFVRFADQKTILLAWIPEEEKNDNAVNKLNYERMNENYRILANAKDIDGTRFNIIKINQPNLIYEKVRINEGERLDNTLNFSEALFSPLEGRSAGDSVYRVACASYLNYYLINKKVLFQSYVNSGTSLEKENQIIRIFKKAFPTREIIPVNALAINWRGGGLHCATLNQFSSQKNP